MFTDLLVFYQVPGISHKNYATTFSTFKIFKIIIPITGHNMYTRQCVLYRDPAGLFTICEPAETKTYLRGLDLQYLV